MEVFHNGVEPAGDHRGGLLVYLCSFNPPHHLPNQLQSLWWISFISRASVSAMLMRSWGPHLTNGPVDLFSFLIKELAKMAAAIVVTTF